MNLITKYDVGATTLNGGIGTDSGVRTDDTIPHDSTGANRYVRKDHGIFKYGIRSNDNVLPNRCAAKYGRTGLYCHIFLQYDIVMYDGIRGDVC